MRIKLVTIAATTLSAMSRASTQRRAIRASTTRAAATPYDPTS